MSIVYNPLLIGDYPLFEVAFLHGHHHFSLQEHSKIEFIYVLKGTVTVLTNEKEYYLSKKNFVLLSSHQQHTISPSTKALFVSIRFAADIEKRYCSFYGLGGSWDEIRKEETERIQMTFEKMILWFLDQNPKSIMICQSLFFELIYLFASIFQNKNSNNSETEERKLIIEKYLMENYRAPIGLSDLAKHLHLSEVYLSKIFKQMFGKNFHDYLKGIRLEAAKEDLIYFENRRILQVAIENGFPNISSFNNIFKKSTGLTPQAFRSQQLQQKKTNLEDDKVVLQTLSILQSTLDKEKVKMKVIECMVNEGMPYDKGWEHAINVGRITDLFRFDIQNHIRQLSRDFSFRYLRIWGLYDDELHIFSRWRKEKHDQSLQFDFSRLDRILDFLGELKLIPYIEMGFKPKLLIRSEGDAILHENAVIPWKNPEESRLFFRSFFTHLTQRYGSEEVGKWYFELWYNYFDENGSTVQYYIELFSIIEDELRQTVPYAKLGGIGDFPDLMRDSLRSVSTRFDFLSAYSYSLFNRSSSTERTAIKTFDLMPTIDQLHALAAENPKSQEIHITEWSSSVSSRNQMNDSSDKACHIIQDCISSIGKIDMLIYWHASDLNAEYKDTQSPLFGGAGLLTIHGIQKPVYYAFRFLHYMGSILLWKNEETLITKDIWGDYQILCTYGRGLRLEANISFEEDLQYLSEEDIYEQKEQEKRIFVLKNISSGSYRITSRLINPKTGSIDTLFRGLGKKEDELLKEDIFLLSKRCIPSIITEKVESLNNQLSVTIIMEPGEFRYINIERIK